MRKMIGVAVALVVVLAVLRRFGPALKDHGMAMCQEIFESLSTPERALDEEPENLVPAIAG